MRTRTISITALQSIISFGLMMNKKLSYIILRQITIIIFIFSLSYVLNAQIKEVSITTGISIEKDIDMPLAGAKAVLYEKGSEVSSTITKSDGMVVFTLKPNSEYLIEISKEGYVSKKVSISTKVPPYENQQFEIAFSIFLFVPCEGLDYSVLQNPVLKVIYNETKRDFLPDKFYDETMRAKLEQLMSNNEKCLEEKFLNVVKKADRLFKEKRYVDARPIYIEAANIRPSDKYVQSQIVEIDRILAQQKDNETAYKNLITQADKQFETKNYLTAKDLYKKALEKKPGEKYPSDQIVAIDKILNQKNKEEQEKLQREATFQQLILVGDENFDSDVCGKALPAYRKALELKPNDQATLQKIKLAEKACNEIQARAAAEKEKQLKYQQAVAKGDSLYNAQNFDAAIAAYQSALAIFPKEKYPQSKIDEINKTQQKQAKEADAQYKKLIKQADKAFDNEDLSTAKNLYQQALAIIPSETYPKEQIKTIDNIEAEKQRMEAEKKANQQKYNSIISQADNAFKNANYQKAYSLYQQALAVIPTETYPKQQLKEIDRIQQENLAQNEKEYNNKIQSGDKNFESKNYSQAIADYRAALAIKPNENYPKQQIDLINKIVDEQKKVEAERKAKQDAYNAAIAKADNFFKNKKYDEALIAYKEATNFLPAEQYPYAKIDEINKIKKQLEQEANFKKAIAQADEAFNQKQYQQAKLFYNQALGIFPDDTYAKTQLAKVETAINDELKKLADAKARQEAYNKAIADADKYFTAKNYDMAKASYQSALSIFPDKSYPSQKINEINNILKEIERNKSYQVLINEGDTYFTARNYEQAKNSYKNALAIKPNENYPKQKIKEIDDLLAQMATQKKLREENERKYKTIIANADKLFDNGNYEKALQEYQNALNILPDEAYPKQRIARINEIKKLMAKETKTTIQPKPTRAEEESVLPDLKFNSNTEREKYLKELLVKYPSGITCEVYKDKNRTITRYIVIRENEANDYREIKYNWGVEYYRNDKPVTALYFNSQVKPREGEYFSKTEM